MGTKNGYVSFVGAGPGDMGLVTQKCLDRLNKADVILYDRLANPRLLRHAKDTCEFIYCGKLPDRHTLRQEKINEQIIYHALSGKYVVRLKGGDPSIFGRVGEEAEAVSNYNIPFEIVPGVTSSVAAAAYAGIPVTHRDYSNCFTIRTGHRSDKNCMYDAKSENLGDTIAYYMGVKNIEVNCRQLMDEGKDPDTPVAVIEWATLGKQRVAVATLKTISDTIAKEGIKNPAMTIVGDVVKLRSKLSWFEKQEFFNKKVLIVDDTSTGQEIEAYFSNKGAEAYTIPTILKKELVLSKEKIEEIISSEQLVFSTAETVTSFLQQLVKNDYTTWELPRKLGFVEECASTVLSQVGLKGRKEIESKSSASILQTKPVGSISGGTSNIYYIHELVQDNRFTEVNERMLREEDWNTVIFTTETSVDFYLNERKRLGLEYQSTPFAYIGESVKEYANARGVLSIDQSIQSELCNYCIRCEKE
ncbi:uroporphyrinogen-III C-methyltransferase [Evansella sp. AB-rgal1]|uniref:uroporphyrinogen-III C-methyltransferase n=1 Tax=Evansella sp. AB-rgal1 TaxID=3242696 RepID=UPI00359CD2EB